MTVRITGLLQEDIFIPLRIPLDLKLSLLTLLRVAGLAQIGHLLAEQRIQQAQP